MSILVVPLLLTTKRCADTCSSFWWNIWWCGAEGSPIICYMGAQNAFPRALLCSSCRYNLLWICLTHNWDTLMFRKPDWRDHFQLNWTVRPTKKIANSRVSLSSVCEVSQRGVIPQVVTVLFCLFGVGLSFSILILTRGFATFIYCTRLHCFFPGRLPLWRILWSNTWGTLPLWVLQGLTSYLDSCTHHPGLNYTPG